MFHVKMIIVFIHSSRVRVYRYCNGVFIQRDIKRNVTTLYLYIRIYIQNDPTSKPLYSSRNLSNIGQRSFTGTLSIKFAVKMPTYLKCFAWQKYELSKAFHVCYDLY